FFLGSAAEFVTQTDGDDGSGTLGIAVMKEKRAGGQANDAEDAVESLRKHAVNFAADETGSGQVEIGESEHVALDAALFLFVESHDHEHGGESGGKRDQRLKADFACGQASVKDPEKNAKDAPKSEGNREKAIGESLLTATLHPEKNGDA